MRLASLLALIAAVLAPSALRAQAAPAPDALAAYEQQAVGVRHLVSPLHDGTTVDEQGRPRYDGRWDAFQGPAHHPIDEETFFRVVGRDDLCLRYRHEAVVKKVVLASGTTALVGGLIFAFLDYWYRNQPQQIEYTGPPPPRPGISPAWGLAIAGTGVAAMIVGHLLDPTPVGADEADRLARDYDQSLRNQLGLRETAWRN